MIVPNILVPPLKKGERISLNVLRTYEFLSEARDLGEHKRAADTLLYAFAEEYLCHRHIWGLWIGYDCFRDGVDYKV